MVRKVCFSLLVLIFCFQRNYGLLLPNVAGSQCTLNSTETDCLLRRINELNDRISLLESKQGKNVINIVDAFTYMYIKKNIFVTYIFSIIHLYNMYLLINDRGFNENMSLSLALVE